MNGLHELLTNHVPIHQPVLHDPQFVGSIDPTLSQRRCEEKLGGLLRQPGCIGRQCPIRSVLDFQLDDNVNAFTNFVLRLLGPIELGELPHVIRAIDDLEKQEWTVEEAVSKLKWLEHVDPTIPEDVALRKMREVDERVALRLAAAT